MLAQEILGNGHSGLSLVWWQDLVSKRVCCKITVSIFCVWWHRTPVEVYIGEKLCHWVAGPPFPDIHRYKHKGWFGGLRV